ncbi:MAG: DUF333 domain-containing protein [Patescibacteria group bacterium]|nr:DUF333 domain-containing protein [Patescibacteria group bacterium]
MEYMKKTILLTILIVSLALSGCAVKKNVKVGDNNQNGKAQNTANENAQIANPASTYCLEQGGNSVIIETEAGQAGICKFNDGSECDEWAFFRKECKQGDKTAGVVETIDTSNWQTYKNNELGVEFKYPYNWVENKEINKNYSLCLVDKNKDNYVEGGKVCLFAIAVDKNKGKYTSPLEVVEEKPETLRQNVKELSVDNVAGMQVTNYIGAETIVVFQEKIYYLLTMNLGSDDLNGPLMNQYNTIISTFKFTN